MLQDFTLPAGNVCKRAGIPFELAADTVIRCHPANWPQIRDGFVRGWIGGIGTMHRAQPTPPGGNAGVGKSEA